MSEARVRIPAWIDVVALPLVNLAMALVVSGLIVLVIGENPLEALGFLLLGAFGYDQALGYTLYYTTNFIFTGLAVAVAFHCGLFNIGGEGQAYVGGLGLGLVCLALGDSLPFILILPLAIAASAAFGAAWAFIPAYLQAYRGSHIVITTIMFNFIASALMVYLLVNVLIEPGQMSPQSRAFAEAAQLPGMHDVLGWFGIRVAASPLNLSLLWALVCCVLVWIFIWRTRWGYELRTVGFNADAARYAGIRPERTILVAMGISGALAGFVALNELMGVQHRIMLNFTAGYGFTGIAVSLMGRNHPVGIVMASLLFGVLYQGGSELAFEMPRVNRDVVVVIQGLVILFSGALAYMFRAPIEGLYLRLARPRLAEG